MDRLCPFSRRVILPAGKRGQDMDGELYAHSVEGRAPQDGWEPLIDHLRDVGELAATFAGRFGAPAWARAAGFLHDIGKASAAYQRYIAGEANAQRGPDHSSAGAREAETLYPRLGRLIAFAVAGHHAGLADGAGHEGGTLQQRLSGDRPLEDYSRWRDHVPLLPTAEELRTDRAPKPDPESPGFAPQFFTRMLFSCLVDADRLATEHFYARAHGEPQPDRAGELRPEHVEAIRAATSKTRTHSEVNAIRAQVLEHALSRAALPPGLFTLTVPTGGGKTLTSLRFAAEHAAAHGLRRIVYVIPFTSIIEQTADVFRGVLGPLAGDILEHHSSFDWDRPPADDNDREMEGREGLAKLRRSSENWDAPIVVTTAVQFWESLFSDRPAKARKLHNLAGAVIVLDEVQTLPVHLLRPCMAALRQLAGNYGASVVLCTATQPALRRVDAALPLPPGKQVQGFDLDETRELAPDPRALYARLKRVEVEWTSAPVDDTAIAARFGEQPQMLCIVNSRAHARELFDRIRDLEGARHLTTLMCPRHRRRVLAEARADLAARRPARIVSTSLIEAGVDISLPEVWRAAAGIDSIAQAAGRCNRSGEMGDLGRAFGRTIVFEHLERKVPRSMKSFYQAATEVRRQGLDPLSEEGVRAYFRELYFVRGHEALDAARLENEVFPILERVAERAQTMLFPFGSIGRAFRLIEDVMEPVIIPYDAEAEAALRELHHAEHPPRGTLRKLQQYTVSVPAKARAAMLGISAEVVRPRDFGDRFVVLTATGQYDEQVGLRIDDPTFLSVESQIIS